MSSPFPLPVLFTAWVWKDGAGIAGEVIRRAKLGGFKTVAVQLSQDTGGDPGSSLDPQDVAFLKDAGLTVVGWDPAGSLTQQDLTGLALDGWLPQVESADQETALLNAIAAGVGKGLPHAIVTTYGGLDSTAAVQKLRAVWPDLFAWVECYAADDAVHADVSRMLSQGQVYGFDPARLLALIGTYRGETPSSYTGLTSANYGGIYLEEPTTDAQLQAFAALAAAPAPTPAPGGTVTNDAADRNKQIASITQAWLDNFGPAPTSRMACEHDIAVMDDGTWLARRQDVRAAIDGKLDVGTVDVLNQELAKAQADAKTAQDELAQTQSDLTVAQASLTDARALLAQAQTERDAALAKIAAATKDLAA